MVVSDVSILYLYKVVCAAVAVYNFCSINSNAKSDYVKKNTNFNTNDNEVWNTYKDD